jgi:hypothetical protein
MTAGGEMIDRFGAGADAEDIPRIIHPYPIAFVALRQAATDARRGAMDRSAPV